MVKCTFFVEHIEHVIILFPYWRQKHQQTEWISHGVIDCLRGRLSNTRWRILNPRWRILDPRWRILNPWWRILNPRWRRRQDRPLLRQFWKEREGKLWILEFQGTDNIVYNRLYRRQVRTLSPRSIIWIRVSAVCTVWIKPRGRIEQAAEGLYIGNAERGFITRRDFSAVLC